LLFPPLLRRLAAAPTTQLVREGARQLAELDPEQVEWAPVAQAPSLVGLVQGLAVASSPVEPLPVWAAVQLVAVGLVDLERQVQAATGVAEPARAALPQWGIARAMVRRSLR
jgi:hypothetical protein